MDATDISDPLQPVADRRLPGLDGLRAVAVGMVLLDHSWGSIPIPGRLGWLGMFLGDGQLGVFVFFVLSGFLITHLLVRERRRAGRISLGKFYARRVLRIFPALYTYLAVIAVLAVAGLVFTTRFDRLAAAGFLTNYAFLFHGRTNTDYWFVGHFWTLSLEEQFYLLWPLAMVMLGNRRSAWLAGGIVALSPVSRAVSYAVWPASRTHLGMMLHCASDSLMMGCLAALLEGTPWLERAVRGRWASATAVAAVAFLGVVSPWLGQHFRGAYSITVGMTLNAVLIAGLLLYVTRRTDVWAVRFLEFRGLRVVGGMSYSLYLWQQLFLGGAGWRWATFPLNLAAAVTAAAASNLLVERPFLRLRGRFAPGGRADPTRTVPANSRAVAAASPTAGTLP